ncbi:hypothetical protein [Desulfocicer niacini]
MTMEDLVSRDVGDEVFVPFEDSGTRKSIEDIASNFPREKRKSVLGDMISDRARTLKAGVVALLEEIVLREDLNRGQFEKIDFEVCQLRDRVLQYESLERELLEGLDGARSEVKSKLEGEILKLERERRKESLECWRDLMFLKKYLMVSLKDYWELVRRRGVLGK